MGEVSNGCPGRHRVVLAALGVVVAIVSAPGAAPAQQERETPPDGSWAGQLDTLARWLERRGHEASCAERCYVLDTMRLAGSVEEGVLEFVVEGAVLADGPVAVPLFGPPDQVRLHDTREGGEPARVGFQAGSYYLFTDARRFTLRGRLTLHGDLALSIPGPLNSLEAELEGGRLVEGSSLSGLRDATIHFERGSGQAEADEPAVFQLSRAVRVGREVGFEYRLVMRSGSDLGVVRLPLRNREDVLEVEGVNGWRVDDGALVLPTSGRVAEVRITGRMAELSAIEPDPRSDYEWLLLESDPEHRLGVAGSARQFDLGESPIARTQASSRLFMVARGQRVELSVERLQSAEVLGAVVRSHGRTVVLTREGDLVAEDRIEYENNGIDYLRLAPGGRPIYLETDGRSERIMHKSGRTGQEIMVPLRTGTHQVRLQSLASAAIAPLGGVLSVPTPSYALTASRATLTVGLPEHVRPLALLGGDRAVWFLGFGDLAAVLVAVLVGWLAFRRRRAWPLAAAALAGLWFFSAALFVVLVFGAALAWGIWLLSRFLSGGKLVAAVTGLAGLAFFAGIAAIGVFAVSGLADEAPSPLSVSRQDWEDQSVARGLAEPSSRVAAGDGALGNRYAQQAVGGVLEGVTPVALPLPAYARSVTVSRELVTEQRPFQPRLYYLSSTALAPLLAAWLLAVLGLAWANRKGLGRLNAAVRERLERGGGRPAGGSAPRQAPLVVERREEAEGEEGRPEGP